MPIKQIISQAECVTPRQRMLCQQAFGAKIIDRYSCEETGWIALQCPAHEHLHVLNASALVEIVDAHGNPCPVGTVGRVLVTSLHSFAMPIVRYELGDWAEWGPPCDCGMSLPVIARIGGRTRHYLQLPSGDTMPMPFVGDELGAITAIHAFRITQYQSGDLELQIETKHPLTVSETQAVGNVFKSKGLVELPLHIRQVERIEWEAGRKREEFIRINVPWDGF